MDGCGGRELPISGGWEQERAVTLGSCSAMLTLCHRLDLPLGATTIKELSYALGHGENKAMTRSWPVLSCPPAS